LNLKYKSRGRGAGAQSIKAFKISRTPKLLIAEPKKPAFVFPLKMRLNQTRVIRHLEGNMTASRL